MYELATNIDIYYFSVPFTHFNSILISLTSYIPFLLLIAVIPIIIGYYRIIKGKKELIFEAHTHSEHEFIRHPPSMFSLLGALRDLRNYLTRKTAFAKNNFPFSQKPLKIGLSTI